MWILRWGVLNCLEEFNQMAVRFAINGCGGYLYFHRVTGGIDESVLSGPWFYLTGQNQVLSIPLIEHRGRPRSYADYNEAHCARDTKGLHEKIT